MSKALVFTSRPRDLLELANRMLLVPALSSEINHSLHLLVLSCVDGSEFSASNANQNQRFSYSGGMNPSGLRCIKSSGFEKVLERALV